MLQHPVLMALLTIAVAMIGYGIARGIRYYVKCQREALLEPPVDLLQGHKYITLLVWFILEMTEPVASIVYLWCKYFLLQIIVLHFFVLSSLLIIFTAMHLP